MLIDIVTIFPDMISGFIGGSIIKRASEKKIVEFRFINPRDFTTDNHRTVDDRPYGGGPGMVMKPEPLWKAIESVKDKDSYVVLMTPRGRRFDQQVALEFSSKKHIIFVCGHYEGVDERVIIGLVNDEISIGDYVLTNGVIAAAVVIDATVRLLPGVLGDEESVIEDSFSENGGLLEYPQYTRPEEFMGMRVPDVLLSGNHGEIRKWRMEQAMAITRKRRPDLLNKNKNDCKSGV